MSDLKDILTEGGNAMGLPGIEMLYEDMDQDLKKYFNDIWPVLEKYTKMSLATKICTNIISKNKYLQYIYLGLKVKYIDSYLEYENDAVLSFKENIKNISNKNIKSHIVEKIIEADIDIVLYLNVFLISSCSGKNLNIPFVLGIKYNEDLEDENIRVVKYYGINIAEMSKKAVVNQLEKGFIFIDELIDKHLNGLNEGIERKTQSDNGEYNENGDMIF